MILIDTHIWVWWLTESSFLKKGHRSFLDKLSADDIAISVISIWEVAKAVENKKLQFKIPLEKWIELASESVLIIPLDAKIIIDSTKLPGNTIYDYKVYQYSPLLRRGVRGEAKWIILYL